MPRGLAAPADERTPGSIPGTGRMGFWDSYTADAPKAPARPAKPVGVDHGPSYNDTAGACQWCGETKRGVLLGICTPCFRAHEEAKA